MEAAIHLGDTGAARAYLDRLEALAAETSGPLLRAEAAYARPLVAAADGTADAVEALYVTALAEGLAGWLDLRARMLLSYGGWLRRQRRPVEARAPLREARDRFDALHFTHLADQARRELRAAGESSSRRTARPWDQLTAQELEIAQLAAEGMSRSPARSASGFTSRTGRSVPTCTGFSRSWALSLAASCIRSSQADQVMLEYPLDASLHRLSIHPLGL